MNKINKENLFVTKQNIIPCHFPWTSIYISPNGDVKHCCSTNLKSLGNLSELPFDGIWNGKLFKTVRQKIAIGDFNGAYCNPNCHGLRTKIGYPWPDKINGNMIIEDNQEKAYLNFKNKKTEIDNFPLNLKLEFTNRCNFRCVMCYYEFKPPYDFIPHKAITKLLEISKYASTVSLMGGEVFMNKQDLYFIKEYAPSEGSYMTFISNGSLLNDKMIDGLRKFKRMEMQISIDGTKKEVFEKVRKNGKWDVVDTNINRIVKISNELNNVGYNWNITLAYVVMASNFEDVSHAIKYAIRLNILIGFHPVKGFHLYEENIFTYKNVLNKKLNWLEIINEAFNTLEENKNNYRYYHNVYDYLLEIKKYLYRPKISNKSLFIRFLKIFIKTNKTENQGVSQRTWRIGHIIEVYYNWKVGNTSSRETLKYIFIKSYSYLKFRLIGKT